MRKELRAISINFQFKTNSVLNIPNLDSAMALFDYDIVTIRPHSLAPFITGTIRNRGDEQFIEGHAYLKAKAVVTGKVGDIKRLLQQGGLLVVILGVLEEYKHDTGTRYTPDDIHTVTNYDFLGDEFSLCVANGTGVTIQIVDPADPFTKLLKSSNVKWRAYMSDRLDYPFKNPRLLAMNGHNTFVGAVLPMHAGHIVFLPDFLRLDEDLFLEACREYRFKEEGTPPPEWVPSVFLPGEAEADKKISHIGMEKEKLAGLLNRALKEREALVAYKKLLYEKGKFQLEPIVRQALDVLGFQTTPSEVIGGRFEIDGRTPIGPGILEVKGSKNQINLDEFSPFIPKLLEDFKETKIQSKGILVGNGLCTQPPQDRLGEIVFSPHVLQAAQTNSVALICSVELYWVVCGILRGEISDAQPIREAILGASGYIDLRRFCGNSVFKQI